MGAWLSVLQCTAGKAIERMKMPFLDGLAERSSNTEQGYSALEIETLRILLPKKNA
jgi:hypothetical protein